MKNITKIQIVTGSLWGLTSISIAITLNFTDKEKTISEINNNVSAKDN